MPINTSAMMGKSSPPQPSRELPVGERESGGMGEDTPGSCGLKDSRRTHRQPLSCPRIAWAGAAEVPNGDE